MEVQDGCRVVYPVAYLCRWADARRKVVLLSIIKKIDVSAREETS
jgi:hypothetical protein